MEPKSQIDRFGVAALVGMALLLAFNQVVVKVTTGGFGPVFLAGLRSAGAIVCIGLWLRWRGIPLHLGGRDVWAFGLASGAVFALEFILLFVALDLTTVSRTTVMMYAMPVWMTLGAHFLLPAEPLTGRKVAGLTVAMAGVALALADRSGGNASWLGDILALGAGMLWAAIGLLAKGTPLKRLRPESQLMWQVLVSAPILLLVAPLFGDLVRDLAPIHVAGLIFQIIGVVTAGFMIWLWLLSIYPGAAVASFSFLTPVFGVFLGWALLGDTVGLGLLGALILVAIGIVLINRPATRG